MVYLSLGSISASVGIVSFHTSRALRVWPCFFSAWSSVSTTASTARRRLRCRAFWNLESRHGIFLYHQPLRLAEFGVLCRSSSCIVLPERGVGGVCVCVCFVRRAPG